MTDDIVTRLREVTCDNRWCGNDPHCRLCDAADEIERLRAIVKDLHHHLGEALYSDQWKTREYSIASHSRYEKEPF